MNKYKGVGVHWGVGTTVVNSIGGYVMQDRSYDRMSEKETLKGATGRTLTTIYYDESDEMTLTVVPSGSYGQSDITPVIPAVGDMVVVTDSVNSFYQATGSSWIVESASPQSSNTGFMKVTYKLKRHPEISTA